MPKSRKTSAATPESESAPETNASCCGDWQQCVSDFSNRAQDFAEKEPAQAVGLAFFAGLVLTVLPVGRVLGGVVRLGFALVRPALLVLGAVKLCEEFEKRNNP